MRILILLVIIGHQRKILSREIEINNFKTTYDDEFFKEIKYFSDSSGVFKYGNP